MLTVPAERESLCCVCEFSLSSWHPAALSDQMRISRYRFGNLLSPRIFNTYLLIFRYLVGQGVLEALTE